MNNISFFTPIYYAERPQNLLPTIGAFAEEYLYLGGKIATLMPDNTLLIEERVSPLWRTALKVVTYLTLILPIISIIIKVVHRRHLAKVISRTQEPLGTQAKSLHEKEGFATLKKILTEFAQKTVTEKTLNNPETNVFGKITQKIIESPDILSKLDIEISPKQMRNIFDKFEIIALRPLKHDKLLVFCGNSPIYCSAMEREYQDKSEHQHKGKDTCDIDLLMNPSVVGLWLKPGLLNYFKQHKKYKLIKGESMDLTKDDQGQVDRELCSNIKQILDKNGVMKEN